METGRKRGGIRLMTAGSALALMGEGLLAGARIAPGFGEWYAGHVYPALVGTIGRFFGIFPFSVSEIGLYLLPVGLLSWGIWQAAKRRFFRLFGGIWLTAGFLLFLYAACCGVNYYRIPFSASMGFSEPEREFGTEDLKELCRWLTDKVNETAAGLGAENGTDGGDLAKEAVAAMERLAKQYPALAGYYPRPKPVLFSVILSIQQCSGIYSPFTIEANYNRDMVSYNIPHTVCHELSHLRGFMREDEANFIGYLACIESDSLAFSYSGYLLGWIYAGNALAAEDFSAYAACYERLDPAVREQLAENSAFWRRYDGAVAEAASDLNDAYLKSNGQSEGVKTYGRAVDLILLDFFENRRISVVSE